MRTGDAMQMAFAAVRSQPLRSLLTALGIAVGIAAVVLRPSAIDEVVGLVDTIERQPDLRRLAALITGGV